MSAHMNVQTFVWVQALDILDEGMVGSCQSSSSAHMLAAVLQLHVWKAQ